MQIKKQLIKYNRGGVNIPEFIVIHDTGNTSVGAGAQNHYTYFNGGDRGASAHYFIDEKEVVQTVENNVKSWHNGKKYKPTAQLNNPECTNSNSIGIEICVNSDGNYNKAVDNAIELTKHLMKELNIPVSNVIRHFDSCGKNCPARMIKENRWEWFKEQLKPTQATDAYITAINKLVARKVISSPDLWRDKKYNNNHVESLIIKVAAML